jgi:Leucine-rich repeat (LRR) protein
MSSIKRVSVETYLSRLPSTTKTIFLSGEKLEKLPDLSKFTLLEELYCANNWLKYLPENLCTMFPHLKILACSNNILTSLPPLGNTLEDLYCINNALSRLPPLPETLKHLHCGLNQLDELPPLPPGLEDLTCTDNKLIKIPPLPETLKTLQCGKNQLTYLPPLVNGLKILACFDNQIISLPELPHLTHLICHRNRLTSLPSLWSGIQDVNFQYNPVYEYANCEEYDGNEFYDENGYNHYKMFMMLYIIETINKFRRTYYLNKFKNKLRNLLWVKIREPKIREKYAPQNILELLNNIGEDSEKFDSLLENL